MDRKQVLPFQYWQSVNYRFYILKTLLRRTGYARRRMTKVEDKGGVGRGKKSKILKRGSIRKVNFILVFPPFVSQLLYFSTTSKYS
jgi:hypothetical protein